MLLSLALSARGSHALSRCMTRRMVDDSLIGQPATIASFKYSMQPLYGSVVVGATVTGTTLLSVVVICTPGCSFGSGGLLASHNKVNAAKPLINHAPILIAR